MILPLTGRTGAPSPYPQPRAPIFPMPAPSPIAGGGPPRWGGGVGMPHPAPVGPAVPFQGTFKKGGKVPKTGAYLLHKDEHVVPKGKRKMTNRKPEKLVSIAALRA